MLLLKNILNQIEKIENYEEKKVNFKYQDINTKYKYVYEKSTNEDTLNINFEFIKKELKLELIISNNSNGLNLMKFNVTEKLLKIPISEYKNKENIFFYFKLLNSSYKDDNEYDNEYDDEYDDEDNDLIFFVYNPNNICEIDFFFLTFYEKEHLTLNFLISNDFYSLIQMSTLENNTLELEVYNNQYKNHLLNNNTISINNSISFFLQKTNENPLIICKFNNTNSNKTNFQMFKISFILFFERMLILDEKMEVSFPLHLPGENNKYNIFVNSTEDITLNIYKDMENKFYLKAYYLNTSDINANLNLYKISEVTYNYYHYGNRILIDLKKSEKKFESYLLEIIVKTYEKRNYMFRLTILPELLYKNISEIYPGHTFKIYRFSLNNFPNNTNTMIIISNVTKGFNIYDENTDFFIVHKEDLNSEESFEKTNLIINYDVKVYIYNKIEISFIDDYIPYIFTSYSFEKYDLFDCSKNYYFIFNNLSSQIFVIENQDNVIENKYNLEGIDIYQKKNFRSINEMFDFKESDKINDKFYYCEGIMKIVCEIPRQLKFRYFNNNDNPFFYQFELLYYAL